MMSSDDITMQGMMMKRKSTTFLGNKWVTRYFILSQDGKLVYYHEKPEAGVESKKNIEVLCNNIRECTIDVVKASDLAGQGSVANSFYITGKGRSKGSVHRTLLVTNGPTDFKQWMLAFEKMKVELHGDGSGVVDEESKTIGPNADDTIVPQQISFNSGEVSDTVVEPSPQSSLADKMTAASQHSVRFAAADVDITKSKEEQEDGKSVTFSVQDAEFILEAVKDVVSGDDKSVTFSDRSVTFSDRDDVISGDRSVTFSDCDDEIMGLKDEQEDGKSVTFSVENAEFIFEAVKDVVSGDDKSVTFSDRSVTFSDRDDVISGDRSVTFSDCDNEIIPDAVLCDYDESGDSSEIHEAATTANVEEEQTRTEDKAVANNIEADELKVFAYGDFYNEMTEVVDENKILSGVIRTSVEEMLDDEDCLNTESKEHHSELKTIPIQFSASSANSRIESFCRRICNLDGFNPIEYDNESNTKKHILSLLGGEAHQDEVIPVMVSDSPISPVSQKVEQFRTMRVVDTGGLTAYKYALNVQGADSVPNGAELLKIIREPLGAPYNWVLFKPSKQELIIEDGGSGGVMELAKVVHRDYNDQVLFGLARVSFAGDLGLRQFWCALEWKGENAYGVKALKSYTECLAPMAEMIGDRSFTLSNSSAMDLSPQIVVDFVKKSCNVELSVDALSNGHEMEQKAIEEYWDKLEAKEKAKVDARNAEKLKRDEKEREARLNARKSKLAETKEVRQTRKEKWSKMNASQLLDDLEKGGLSGWVLFQVNIE